MCDLQPILNQLLSVSVAIQKGYMQSVVGGSPIGLPKVRELHLIKKGLHWHWKDRKDYSE